MQTVTRYSEETPALCIADTVIRGLVIFAEGPLQPEHRSTWEQGRREPRLGSGSAGSSPCHAWAPTGLREPLQLSIAQTPPQEGHLDACFASPVLGTSIFRQGAGFYCILLQPPAQGGSEGCCRRCDHSELGAASTNPPAQAGRAAPSPQGRPLPRPPMHRPLQELLLKARQLPDSNYSPDLQGSSERARVMLAHGHQQIRAPDPYSSTPIPRYRHEAATPVGKTQPQAARDAAGPEPRSHPAWP